jgi:2-polyprenyl-6-methoxyphenol hydroxylase-like FAD-dependent oxidoreductase
LWFRLTGPEVVPLERWLAGRFLTVVGGGVSFALFAEASGATLRLGWVAEAGVSLPAESAGWRSCWAEALPAEAGALLAELPARAIEGPQRFPVRVGWAPCWHTPGLLLLGDAAHPMSPLRAQGINMALRDALLTARLLKFFQSHHRTGQREPLDALLAGVQTCRLPEVRKVQAWQAQEARLGALLRQQAWLRRTLVATLPWSGALARQRWIQRQHRLRNGLKGATTLPK